MLHGALRGVAPDLDVASLLQGVGVAPVADDDLPGRESLEDVLKSHSEGLLLGLYTFRPWIECWTCLRVGDIS